MGLREDDYLSFVERTSGHCPVDNDYPSNFFVSLLGTQKVLRFLSLTWVICIELSVVKIKTNYCKKAFTACKCVQVVVIKHCSCGLSVNYKVYWNIITTLL